MQKWIRDRVRRRKKKPTETNAATEVTPPLQPAYPDAVETTERSEPDPVPNGAPAEGESSPPERPRPKRRRRKKPAPAVAAAAEDPSVAEQELEQGKGEGAAEAAVETAEPVLEPASTGEVAPIETATAPTQAEGPPVSKVRKGSKGAVVLAVGLPGSGKSTWFKRHGVTPLSSDMVRHLLFDNPTEQRYQDLVFGTLRSLLRARLIARMPMNHVDATNLSPKERRHWIRMAKDFGYDAHAVYFDVPMEVCMDRNRRRNRVVPDDVMHRMAAKLRPPTFDEGFAKIVVVRVKPRADATGGVPETNPEDREE